MKTSELIHALQQSLKQHGDLQILQSHQREARIDILDASFTVAPQLVDLTTVYGSRHLSYDAKQQIEDDELMPGDVLNGETKFILLP